MTLLRYESDGTTIVVSADDAGHAYVDARVRCVDIGDARDLYYALVKRIKRQAGRHRPLKGE